MLRNVGTHLPKPIVNRLSETPIDICYNYINAATSDFENVVFETPVGGVEIKIPSHELAGYHIGETNNYETAFTERLCESLGPNDVFYDLGSHWGYYSSVAITCGVFPKNVFCFDSDTFYYYCSNVTHRDDMATIELARVGSVPVRNMFGIGQISVDHYASENKPPTVVKMDVQGAEYDVLLGMKDVIKNHHPDLFIEVHPHILPDFGYSETALIEFLQSYGYSLSYENSGTWRPERPSEKSNKTGYYMHAMPAQ